MQDRFSHAGDTAKAPAPVCRPLTRRTLLLGLPLLAGAGLLAAPAPAATYLVESLPQYQAALADLSQSKTVALVDVGAEWCAFCKVIDTKILPDERVAKLMQSYGLIRIDVTAMTDGHRALLRHLRVDGPPTVFIVDAASGGEHENTRSVGNFSTENLIARLKPFAGR
ncbi:thioredoxin family protein [Aquamicrobium terrae]